MVSTRSGQGKARTSEEPSQSGSTRPASREYSLWILVFTAGAVLMALEISGSRLLAPWFGNSVFVWGSLISVFLTALSLGYYVGGVISDRYPSRKVLNSGCLLVGVYIFGIAFCSNGVNAWLVEQGLGEQSGPLVASLLLFLLPSVGLGAVSPYAIRLATSSVTSVGKTSGNLYAVSTMGSIVGTLLTTFVLIPSVGLVTIVKGQAVVLIAVAFLTMPTRRRVDMVAGLLALGGLTLLGALIPAGEPELFAGETLLVDTNTPYHNISVVSHGGIRELRFDRYVESAIRERAPYVSLARYTHYFHLALLAQPDIQRSLFIGAGGGIGPRTFHAHNPQMQIDVVDIDPEVLRIARRYFFLEDVPQIRCVAEDGRMFVRTAQEQYDCIVLDAFTIGGRIPFHLVTQEFFAQCRDQLTENGVFVMNINSALEGPSSGIFQSVTRTLSSVFPQTWVFAMDRNQRPASQTTNLMLVCSRANTTLTPEEWKARLTEYQTDSSVTAGVLQHCIADLLPELPDLSQATLFTDDHAPIEAMPF